MAVFSEDIVVSINEMLLTPSYFIKNCQHISILVVVINSRHGSNKKK